MNQQEEHKKEHLIAVEDVMRVKKQLAGFGIAAHQDVITDWYKVFASYYDCDIETLHNELERLSAEASEFVQRLHPWGSKDISDNENKINRILRDDEQDHED